jgi:TPP-dependent pyruvate/acetoin dehydrogenase alpha subunit
MDTAVSPVANEVLLESLRGMMRIRATEETLALLYPEAEMRTPTHFSIGQEAVAVGVCTALCIDDVVFSGHRCHAHYLAKGGSLLGMVAELYGREAGCCHGRGGSVHLNDPAVGMIASSAILGETIAAAVGAALAFAMNGEARVSVPFFGDACIEEGVFHESVNFAVVRRLPVVFVCENNFYSVETPLRVRQPTSVGIAERARSYGLPALRADGNDVEAVHVATRAAVEGARRGDGPSLLEFVTYRWREHVGPLFDYDRGFRSKEELDAWMVRCPIRRASARAIERGLCTAADVERWRRALQDEVDATVSAAKAGPFPDPADILANTY